MMCNIITEHLGTALLSQHHTTKRGDPHTGPHADLLYGALVTRVKTQKIKVDYIVLIG